MLLDSQLLPEYISTFYGFGTYSAGYWFVGMEEGGDRTAEENINRITRWRDRGRPELSSFVADSVPAPSRSGSVIALPSSPPGESSSASSSPPRASSPSRQTTSGT